jgi:hypothetical protein
VRHSYAFSRHRSAIIHYRDGYTQPVDNGEEQTIGLSFRSAAEKSAFHFSSPRSEIAILLLPSSCAAKDPDEFNTPLPLEPFNQQFLRPLSLRRALSKNIQDAEQQNRTTGNLQPEYPKRHLLFTRSQPYTNIQLDKTAAEEPANNGRSSIRPF